MYCNNRCLFRISFVVAATHEKISHLMRAMITSTTTTMSCLWCVTTKQGKLNKTKQQIAAVTAQTQRNK